MAVALEYLENAAHRLDQVVYIAHSAAQALDHISDRLADDAVDVVRRAEELLTAVVKTRDYLAGAGV